MREITQRDPASRGSRFRGIGRFNQVTKQTVTSAFLQFTFGVKQHANDIESLWFYVAVVAVDLPDARQALKSFLEFNGFYVPPNIEQCMPVGVLGYQVDCVSDRARAAAPVRVAESSLLSFK